MEHTKALLLCQDGSLSFDIANKLLTPPQPHIPKYSGTLYLQGPNRESNPPFAPFLLIYQRLYPQVNT